MPAKGFVTVKDPKTGAYWDCHVSRLKVLGLEQHVVQGKPVKASADRPKSRKPKAPPLDVGNSTPADTEEKEGE